MKAYVAPICYVVLLVFLGRFAVLYDGNVTWARLIAKGLVVGVLGFGLLIVFEWRVIRPELMKLVKS
jgi:hypothetical protein